MLEEEAEEADNGKDNVDEIKTITRNYRRFNNYSRKFSAGGGADQISGQVRRIQTPLGFDFYVFHQRR
jgi:hypothetical protein